MKFNLIKAFNNKDPGLTSGRLIAGGRVIRLAGNRDIMGEFVPVDLLIYYPQPDEL